VRTFGVVSPTRVSGKHVNAGVLEKVAMATFAASDAVLAFRDIGQQSSPIEECLAMAGRIMEPQAMLLISLDSAYRIGDMVLANSGMRMVVGTVGDASRLVACPWVTVVMHRAEGWFTLDASLVQRDLLTVTDRVRETFGAAPARPPKPAASPESVDQLRKDLNERLDKLEKTVGDVKTTRQAPPSATRVPPPAESYTSLSLRASVATLERLTGVKRVADQAPPGR
jgi:hypothetical protein